MSSSRDTGRGYSYAYARRVHGDEATEFDTKARSATKTHEEDGARLRLAAAARVAGTLRCAPAIARARHPSCVFVNFVTSCRTR